jgi:hypothetical protein
VDRRAVGLPAATFSADPSADTLVLLPIRMIVNETDFPPFAKLSTTMLALLMTDERESHPCSFMVEQQKSATALRLDAPLNSRPPRRRKKTCSA